MACTLFKVFPQYLFCQQSQFSAIPRSILNSNLLSIIPLSPSPIYTHSCKVLTSILTVSPTQRQLHTKLTRRDIPHTDYVPCWPGIPSQINRAHPHKQIPPLTDGDTSSKSMYLPHADMGASMCANMHTHTQLLKKTKLETPALDSPGTRVR